MVLTYGVEPRSAPACTTPIERVISHIIKRDRRADAYFGGRKNIHLHISLVSIVRNGTVRAASSDFFASLSSIVQQLILPDPKLPVYVYF